MILFFGFPHCSYLFDLFSYSSKVYFEYQHLQAAAQTPSDDWRKQIIAQHFTIISFHCFYFLLLHPSPPPLSSLPSFNRNRNLTRLHMEIHPPPLHAFLSLLSCPLCRAVHPSHLSVLPRLSQYFDEEQDDHEYPSY